MEYNQPKSREIENQIKVQPNQTQPPPQHHKLNYQKLFGMLGAVT